MSVSAVHYKDSEGPTKVDLGEDDEQDGILGRADDSTDAKVIKNWKKDNPLDWGWDGGDADETVLTMLDGSVSFPSHTVLTMSDGSLRFF